MLPMVFLFAVVLAFLGIGLFLVIGTFKKVDVLVHPPNGWFEIFPYWFLKKIFGVNSIYYFHIFIGVVFILGAIWILLYSFSN
jgi:hypothetical protein